MDTPEGRYVELPTADVPMGWSNHPDLFRVKACFTQDRVNETLRPSRHFSRPQPILTDNQSVYIFKEQGRGYHVWNEISGGVAEIKENSWEDIIAKLKEGGLFSLTLSPLRTVDDPSGEPTSNIPYLPNPDFVDRPHLMEKFQVPPQRSVLLYGPEGSGKSELAIQYASKVPPQRSVLLYGPEGSGKSELAIQYASKVRTQSPKTWVFWLCATTKQKFDEDLAAISDILPEGPPTNQKMNRKDFVLNWLRTQHWEHWLLVVDDIRSNEVDVLSVIHHELWDFNRNGSFIFTSMENLQDTRPFFKGSVLVVNSLEENEALQLLQKKLRQPLANANGHNLVTGIDWTPLAVELAAASLNKGLTSISKFIKDMKSHKHGPFAEAFFSLSHSLNLYEWNLLYFISFFHPPEVPALWLRSYLEWRKDEKEFNKLEDSLQWLTKSSLLVKVSGTNAYKMQTEVQTFVVAQLSIKRNGEFNQFRDNTRSFVDSRNFIPSHRFDPRRVRNKTVEKSMRQPINLRDAWGNLKRITGLGGQNVQIRDFSMATIEPV